MWAGQDGPGVEVLGLGFTALPLRCQVLGFGSRVQDGGFGSHGLGLWVLRLGVWVSAFKALRLGSVRLPLDDHLVVLSIS